MTTPKIRNVAIIAHVDHGKTTLVDGLLKQSHVFRDNQAEMSQTLIMDSMDQEHERGITITAKQTSVFYKDYKINIIDTPGHADFSGEVERTLNMADGVILVVDAQEGPMPQTKFVLGKALALHLRPVVVINKIDKPAARISEVESEIADLFLELASDESQLNYPIYYAIARDGKAGKTTNLDDNLNVIFEAIINEIPAPKVDEHAEKGAQLLVAALASDNYLGKYCIGKLVRGTLKKGETVSILHQQAVNEPSEGHETRAFSPERSEEGAFTAIRGKIDKIFTYNGLGREETDLASTGDIIAITGLPSANIGDTIATAGANGEDPEVLPTIELEVPPHLASTSVPIPHHSKVRKASLRLPARLPSAWNANLRLISPFKLFLTASATKFPVAVSFTSLS